MGLYENVENMYHNINFSKSMFNEILINAEETNNKIVFTITKEIFK